MATAAPGAGARPDAGYLFGVALVALAGAFWSIGGVLVRWVEAADAWQIIFYRSALARAHPDSSSSRSAIAAGSPPPSPASAGPALLAGACLSGGFIGYVLALHHTTVANASFMLGTAPFFAAILGRWFLREEVRRATWLAMTLALCRHRGDGRRQPGDRHRQRQPVRAGREPQSFAVYNVLLRRGRANDMMPCVVIAGLIAAADRGCRSVGIRAGSPAALVVERARPRACASPWVRSRSASASPCSRSARATSARSSSRSCR